MKRIFLILAVAVALFGISQQSSEFAHDVEPRDFISDLVNNTINGIIKNISDPITVKSYNLSLPSNSSLSGSLNISNLYVYGLRSTFCPNLTVNILNMSLNATVAIKAVNVSVDYDADLLLGGVIPLYGNGSIKFTLEKIALYTAGKANLTGGLSISNLTVGLGLNDAKFNITGLLDNEKFSLLITQILNDNVVKFIKNHQEFFTKTLSSVFQNIINSMLHGNKTITGDVFDDSLIEEVIPEITELF